MKFIFFLIITVLFSSPVISSPCDMEYCNNQLSSVFLLEEYKYLCADCAKEYAKKTKDNTCHVVFERQEKRKNIPVIYQCSEGYLIACKKHESLPKTTVFPSIYTKRYYVTVLSGEETTMEVDGNCYVLQFHGKRIKFPHDADDKKIEAAFIEQLDDCIDDSAVNSLYRKLTLFLHPDKTDKKEDYLFKKLGAEKERRLAEIARGYHRQAAQDTKTPRKNAEKTAEDHNYQRKEASQTYNFESFYKMFVEKKCWEEEDFYNLSKCSSENIDTTFDAKKNQISDDTEPGSRLFGTSYQPRYKMTTQYILRYFSFKDKKTSMPSVAENSFFFAARKYMDQYHNRWTIWKTDPQNLDDTIRNFDFESIPLDVSRVEDLPNWVNGCSHKFEEMIWNVAMKETINLLSMELKVPEASPR
ncbi:hypothetical protein CI610_01872 [invertebrate metagenome]|uniref:J domain-containing protein n=1 Tax=invertebrate metagenome TaxID=1711999 RepID=A0A2H9T7G2_9ZZZZ